MPAGGKIKMLHFLYNGRLDTISSQKQDLVDRQKPEDKVPLETSGILPSLCKGL